MSVDDDKEPITMFPLESTSKHEIDVLPNMPPTAYGYNESTYTNKN
jgi:hypothetical protein